MQAPNNNVLPKFSGRPVSSHKQQNSPLDNKHAARPSETRTIVITGTANGIGLAYLRYYAQNPLNHVIACDKDPTPLENIPNRRAAVSTHTLEVNDEFFLSSLSTFLSGRPVHLLIHCVGVRGLNPQVEREAPSDVTAAEVLEATGKKMLTQTFNVNAVGTFEVIRTLLPSLRAASEQLPGEERARVVVMSSRMGSMSQNTQETTPGGYAYRASKAALNSIVRTFSVDVPDVFFMLIHPGRVNTNLVLCCEEGSISTDDCVWKLIKIMDADGVQNLPSGLFWDINGQQIPW
ncbi:NAD(P)-binding protein [Aulographum hederae CBS 113979]|uniref:NAD(P)-binding protein n=1 Tax=Aulographum hederae CBS 113979 TaxID=1176131 RepID=A0A6G1HBD5_9PEZI|nr:NAD(P)-binding protein [Aulographum hederae CBS 113979]